MAAGELIAFGWMASALGTAVVAQSKNRGGCAWFFAGLVGGPVGLLAAILMPKAPEPGSGEATADANRDPPD